MDQAVEVQKQNVGVKTRAQQARVHVMTHQEAVATDVITGTCLLILIMHMFYLI
ncbi:hypothetical protein SLEP1_g31363 [Rubroshorea leprosula]|uniref:Uncharacterized protein n=1 Tax=Rubroshorea leprosula TaxID=152421 RepID=A0AAV5K343_9ROSI|nr:hypothetical protein SLEP1_g31363 [Rubroshorea leprosula]